MCFTTETSTSATPGPIRVFRPKLPNVPKGCGTKAHGSKYSAGVPTGVPGRTPGHPFETPLVGFVLAPETRFGRSAKLAPDSLFCERLAEFSTVNGTPLTKVAIEPTLQPCRIFAGAPCRFFPNGNS